jgi:hypothetical protein
MYLLNHLCVAGNFDKLWCLYAEKVELSTQNEEIYV